MDYFMSFEILKNVGHSDVPAMLLWLLLIALFLLIVYVLACWIPAKRRERKKNMKEKQPKVKKEKIKKVKQPKKVVETKSQETTPTHDENESQGHSSEYVSPLILDRQKYEIALQEKLEREKQERLNRQAAETARLEALKNKEFQSRAGFISTLQRFSKKEALEKQIAEEGKVDRELLNTYLNHLHH